MRCTKKLRIGLLVAVSFLTLASAAQATYQGKIQFLDGAYVAKQVDPLGQYGVNPSDHLHVATGAADAAGNSVFSATLTTSQLEAAPDTMFEVGSDKSLLWVPAVIKADGSVAPFKNVGYYMENVVGQTLSAPSSYNPGLRFVEGDHTCTSTSCAIGRFICSDNTAVNQATIPTAAQCPAGRIQEIINHPLQCWDGVSLGKGFGDSTPAANLTNQVPCPAGDKTVPGILFVAELTDAAGAHLSSDQNLAAPGVSAHFDYFFNFKPSALQAMNSRCMTEANWPQNDLTCRAWPHGGGPESASVYKVDPVTDQPENGMNGEPLALVTP